MRRINLLIAHKLIQMGLLERSLIYLYRALGNANASCPSARSAIFTAINAVRQS